MNKINIINENVKCNVKIISFHVIIKNIYIFNKLIVKNNIYNDKFFILNFINLYKLIN